MFDLTQIPDGTILLEPRDVYDACIVGMTDQPDDHWPRQTRTPCAVYSAEQCIEAWMRANQTDWDEAQEWFDFNTSGAWFGEGTPTFVWDRPDEPEEEEDED